ncbi:hypothetical protein ABL78_6975 [Leptomonas seymouri]|uniref:Uncharacterized protein n=1 Tax=Leptomonas seymouri TaxID=5684 RepID=A0A0N1PBQ4_LEPSE|nr:hypothetical protein ABL78_6975 [Leptomonas seymouri]|eukprot:KPI83983.1 hypothetical protein ABL78_6975 [Leptomonas seymouri]
MVNAVLSGFHSDRSRKDQHPSPSGQTVTEENPISKAVNGKANAAANGGSTPGSTHTNTASGAAAAASGDEEGNVSLAKGGSLASREAMDARPQAPEALPPMTYADAQKRLSGPQWPSAASRLPLRARMTSSSAVGAHRMSSTNGRKTGGDAPQPPSRLLLAPASIMAPETAEAVSTEKTEDHFEKYEEAPVTSPSATTRRTTVRSASRSSVVNAPHRVATCALEKATVGVRRYRPNMNGRLREVMPVPSTRGAPGLCGVAVESSPSQPSERLPPL